MLIAKKDTVIKYNGKIKELKEGERFDIRDFDVSNQEVKGAEKHITMKSLGCFDVSNEKNDGLVSKEMTKELAEAKKRAIDLERELSDTKKQIEHLTDKHAAMAGEVEEAKKEVNSMKKQVNKYKQEAEELEDEVKKLRKQLTKA